MVQPLLVKFGGLLVKTLTKPLANQIKHSAQQPGWIRQACLRYGRAHHKWEARAALRLAGHDAKSVKPASDDAAVGIGATVFSEFFVFSVAGAVLAFELWKKSQDDEAAREKKEKQAAEDKRAIEDRFLQLETEVSERTQQHERREALEAAETMSACALH